MRKYFIVVLLPVFVFVLSGCGNFNIFSWAHTRGSSDSAVALQADADAAFSTGDYGQALVHFTNALAKDPTSSVAMYGVSKSAYADAGLGFASVISAMSTVGGSSAPPMPQGASGAPLKDALKFISPSYATTNIFDESQITDFRGFIDKLYKASALGVRWLRKIADGKADGKIRPDNPNININLAISLLMNGALRIFDTDKNGSPLNSGDLIQLVMVDKKYVLQYKVGDSYTTDTSAFSVSLSTAQKEDLKLQVKIFVCYLLGKRLNGVRLDDSTLFGSTFSFPPDNGDGNDTAFSGEFKGAIDYIESALTALNIKERGVIGDLKTTFTKLAKGDPDYRDAQGNLAEDPNSLKKLWKSIQ